MAYASLASFAQTLDQILNHDSYSTYHPGKQQFISVQKCVTLLQRFLEDFPEIAYSLEGRIRDVANEAEDMIENLMWEQRRLHLERFGDLSRGRISYHFRGLEKATEDIESIAEQVMKIMNSLRIKEQKFDDSPTATSSSRVAPTHKDVLIGFDDDLVAVKARLCGESFHLQIIPIVGMGGIGKTTLVRNAFDDPLIMEFFHIRAWVTVSQVYSVQEILSSLLVSIEGFTNEKSGKRNECVEEQVYKRLKGRRYLIVMDDMWSTKAWEDLKMVLPDDGNKSRIMLTTRVSDVATYPDPCTSLYEMHLMDVDQSWDLLRHKVFASQDCPLELEDIGKEIARSCRGLPLAIIVIAGLLSVVSRTPASWGEIAENVNSTIATKDGDLNGYYQNVHLL